ncbi:MAG: hypothetical protein WA970_25085 [Gammaproteobacteria bacterium]
MKINSKDLRVQEGEKFKLKKLPTLVKSVYQSKEQYQSNIKNSSENGRGAKRAATTSIGIEPLCGVIDFSGHGRRRRAPEAGR